MFDKNVLQLDPSAEVDRITATLREQVLGQLRRRGAVVGISGGIVSESIKTGMAEPLAKSMKELKW